MRLKSGETRLSFWRVTVEFSFFSYVFHNGILEPRYDWFHCVVNIPEDAVRVGEPHEGEQMTTLTSGKWNLYHRLYNMEFDGFIVWSRTKDF